MNRELRKMSWAIWGIGKLWQIWGGVIQLQEEEENEKKESKLRIKKLKRQIEKNDLEELIIDRSKTPDGVNTQIDVSVGRFQKLE